MRLIAHEDYWDEEEGESWDEDDEDEEYLYDDWDDESEDDYEKEGEELTGQVVDGLAVREDIPNVDSISASLYEWEELSGIRQVPISELGDPLNTFYSKADTDRSQLLARQIEHSGEINPLIVVVDDEGPYVLEGGHRFVALGLMGKQYVPALVVLDLEKVDDQGAHFEDKYVQASILSPVRDSRASDVWITQPGASNEQLRPSVRETILKRCGKTGGSGFEEYLLEVWMIGSITGYQYDEDADLDINVLVDIDRMVMEQGGGEEEIRAELRNRFRDANGILLEGTEHPINFFLNVDGGYPPADGIYDVVLDEWIKEPGHDHPLDYDPAEAYEEAIARGEEIASKVDVLYGIMVRARRMAEYPHTGARWEALYRAKAAEVAEILYNITDERHEAFELAKRDTLIGSPNDMPANVTYKYLERSGALERMHRAADLAEESEPKAAKTAAATTPEDIDAALAQLPADPEQARGWNSARERLKSMALEADTARTFADRVKDLIEKGPEVPNQRDTGRLNGFKALLETMGEQAPAPPTNEATDAPYAPQSVIMPQRPNMGVPPGESPSRPAGEEGMGGMLPRRACTGVWR